MSSCSGGGTQINASASPTVRPLSACSSLQLTEGEHTFINFGSQRYIKVGSLIISPSIDNFNLVFFISLVIVTVYYNKPTTILL